LPGIAVRNLVKRFDTGILAVDHVSLEVSNGELVTLLGPSGCGKTTTLRCIAGFDDPDEGEILLDGSVINDVPSNKRNLVMVFQNWALWPHMTVFKQLEFGLQVRKIPSAERPRLIKEALTLVNLTGTESRYPNQLSGGQQQRVALARALVVKPKALLLDEPLSNLDAKLRLRTRVELRQLQRKLGLTVVYVTHDQEEGMAISDKMVVMHEGRVVQTGTPREIYEHPRAEFVARFVGSNNVWKCAVTGSTPEHLLLRTDFGVELKALDAGGARGRAPGDRVTVCVRPEGIELGAGQPAMGDSNLLKGRVTEVVYLGAYNRYQLDVGGEIVTADSKQKLDVGQELTMAIPPENCTVIE
jgi:ABC-type Fe3+/spermidine/putrescine transport system ATPase subunit